MKQATGREIADFKAARLEQFPEASRPPYAAQRTLTDSTGHIRFGTLKGEPIQNVPASELGSLREWAKDVAAECQEELDRRVEELHEQERIRLSKAAL